MGESRGLEAGFERREELKPGYVTCHGRNHPLGVVFAFPSVEGTWFLAHYNGMWWFSLAIIILDGRLVMEVLRCMRIFMDVVT